MDILYFGHNQDTDQVQEEHQQENQIQDGEVSDDLGQVAYIVHNHWQVHHTPDNAGVVVADNCYLEDHTDHVGILEELHLVLEVEEDSLEMEGDSNLMREVDHKEDNQDQARIHILGLEEEARIRVVAAHNNLEVAAEKIIIERTTINHIKVSMSIVMIQLLEILPNNYLPVLLGVAGADEGQGELQAVQLEDHVQVDLVGDQVPKIISIDVILNNDELLQSQNCLILT